MTGMRKLAESAVGHLARILIVIAQAGLAIMMAMTVISIVGRATTGVAIPDSVTFSEILMIFVVLLPMLAVQQHGGHVSVDLLHVEASSRRAHLLHAFACLLCAVAFILLAWSLGVSSWKALVRHEVYRGVMSFPIWPFRAVAAFAIGSLAAGFALSAFRPPRNYNGDRQGV